MFSYAKILFSLLFSLNISAAFSQTVFWTETFNNGCASACLAGGVNTGNGAWSTIDGGSQATPNLWYVSCAEDGNTAGNCGSACAGGAATGASLHVGANDGVVPPDPGAAYDAGGALACSILGVCTASNQRAVSPSISTVGYSGISVSFDYIEFGQAGHDYCTVYYSTDGGVTWNLLLNVPQTSCCGGACNGTRQGLWAHYASATLPATCDNIANFKISFLWINDNDGAGKDPSFAADNLKLSYLLTLPIELLSFTTTEINKTIHVNWTTTSETNNDYFTIEKSSDGVNFSELQRIKGAGNSSQLRFYSVVDDKPFYGLNYYRLKQTDFDGKFTYSQVNVVKFNEASDLGIVSLYYSSDNHSINVIFEKTLPTSLLINLYDVTGRPVYNYPPSTMDQLNLTLPLTDLSSGIYFVRLSNGNNSFVSKIIF